MEPAARVLVVGSGITGAATSALLGSRLAGVSVNVWERFHAIGGRMSTTHAACDPRMHADLGAQYISSGAGGGNNTEELAYSTLIENQVLTLFGDTVLGTRAGHDEQQHYVAPGGLGSMCKHLLSSSEVTLGRTLTALNQTNTPRPGWCATSSDGKEEVFDAVVLAVPRTAALALTGEVSELLSETNLSGVQYSSRWAVALYYPDEAWQVLQQLPWAARYVTKQEDDALVFISFESRKRGFGAAEPDGPGPVLLVHTSVPWGLSHMEDSSEQVIDVIVNKVNQLIQIETSQNLTQPVEAQAVLWRESQVRPGTEMGGDALLLRSGAPLVLAGDCVSGSNFENCVRSATKAAEIIASKLTDRRESCAL